MGKKVKDVALALSSGGPRGFAYIGAIEELESRGYRITSVAGTSIGSLIGGMYASGRLNDVKEWLYSLDSWKVFTLMDISISMNHLVKGDKVIEALKRIVPDMDIEDMDIPYKAIATDFYTGEEVIFDKGSLFQAIRASISIPSLFRPVKIGTRTMIDGGIANAFPLNRVERNGHDILVGFDVNDVDTDGIREIIRNEAKESERREAEEKAREEEMRHVIANVRRNTSMTLLEKLKLAGSHGQKLVKQVLTVQDRQEPELFDLEDNYYSVLSRTFSLMNHSNSELSIRLTPPDVLVKMPFDAFGDISDYTRAKEISDTGRALMKEALDNFENEHEKV